MSARARRPPAGTGRPPAGAGRPLTRWLVVAALVVGLLASLTLSGLLGPAAPGRTVGPPVLADAGGLGPVLGVGPASLRSAPPASGGVGVALVDVGPDRAWRAAEQVLARHGARATWFLSGRTALERPATVRRARERGGEIGVTGFTGMYLVVIQSVAAALAGTRLRRHKLRRTGLAAVPAVAYRRER